MKPKSSFLYAVVIFSICVAVNADAFQIEPKATKSARLIMKFENWKTRFTDRASPLVASFMTDPIHEYIANLIYGCDGENDNCSKPSESANAAPAAVIAGAEWNDNPPFMLAQSSMKDCLGEVIQLPKKSVCWAKLLKDASAFLEPGRITNFHSYGKQDHKKHAEMDKRDALEIHLASAQPNVVDVGKALLDFSKAEKPWAEVKGYLECVFALDEAATPAGPGELFVEDGI